MLRTLFSSLLLNLLLGTAVPVHAENPIPLAYQTGGALSKVAQSYRVDDDWRVRRIMQRAPTLDDCPA
ncbi:hypothetical protein Ga0061063_1609 [Gulbenkiania indica]|uniref:Uncharacterized protein n=1 Tax=Gulbenkiania indica TaxID=375574 RepID=A0A0K6GXE7_9NEIS|nr:hypothetical protein [Gulbenkiania indica]CUA83168.1 hypothetical protein Ga0061063_1609 [Gulbenkiania indica]